MYLFDSVYTDIVHALHIKLKAEVAQSLHLQKKSLYWHGADKCILCMAHLPSM